MGTCASTQYSKDQWSSLSTTAMVIHSVDGRVQEFRQPVKGSNVLSNHQQPDMFFLCNAEDMFVNCHVPHVPGEEDLQPGQIYFVMPISKSYRPISLHELCLLAIKASSAIEKSLEMKKMSASKTTSLSGRRKRNGSVRRNQKVDFQLALKQLA